MSNDNLGNFFNADDFDGDEDDAESWKPVKVHGNALFKKAIEILNLTRTLCDVLGDEEEAEATKRLMLENAMLVPAKIKGGMAIDHIYSAAMENAVIIKVNIVQLKDQLWACNAIHNIEEKYLDVLRNEIEAFRKIFVQWVTAFDKENDMPDVWHLFNDPSSFPDI
jgi:hypothetical protein